MIKGLLISFTLFISSVFLAQVVGLLPSAECYDKSLGPCSTLLEFVLGLSSISLLLISILVLIGSFVNYFPDSEDE